MIANVIVLSTLVLAGLYVVLWFHNADLRRRIEEPKERFQQQIEAYDARFNANNGQVNGRD